MRDIQAAAGAFAVVVHRGPCAGYIGAASGTALTGILIDHAGVSTGLVTCAPATTVAAPLVWHRRATL